MKFSVSQLGLLGMYLSKTIKPLLCMAMIIMSSPHAKPLKVSYFNENSDQIEMGHNAMYFDFIYSRKKDDEINYFFKFFCSKQLY